MSSLAAKGASVTVREDLFWPTAGTATVTVTDADGGTVAASLPAAYDAQTATWTATLTATHTATPGMLTLAWSHSDGSTATTSVDVRDGNPFPLAVLAKVLARGNGTYTDADKQAAAEAAVLAIESACGVPLVTQRSRESLPGTGTSFVSSYQLCQQVVAPAGAAVTPGGIVTFSDSQSNPTITLDHGYPALDDSGARAVALLASSRLADGPWDDRGMSMTGEGGTVRLMTQGVGATHFSIPEVQEFVRRRRVVQLR